MKYEEHVMRILMNTSTVGLWRDILHEAETTCDTTLGVNLENYLISLLVRYTDKPELAKCIMAPMLLEGLNAPPKARELALQGVGDSCLLFAGFFPGVAQARMVRISYFIHLGRGAYAAISQAANDLYSLLAQYFVSIMDILQSIRQYTKEFPSLMPLEAYELWNDSGSKRALNVLKQYTQATAVKLLLDENDIGLIKRK